MNGKAVLLAALMVLMAQAAFARGQREAAAMELRKGSDPPLYPSPQNAV